MNKKGLELGINFLVVIILTIVIVSLGFAMFFRMFDKVETVGEGVDQQTKVMLDNSFETGDPVVLIRNSRTIRAGEDDIFHLGISNTLQQTIEFKVEIKQDTNQVVPFEVIYKEDPFDLEPGERNYMAFKVLVPGNAPKETYIFDVNVCYPTNTNDVDEGCSSTHNSRHYLLQKVYVNVP